MDINFKGQVVLVTGGTSNIGRAIVRQFGACGADVAVHYLSNKEMADKLVKEVEEMGQRAIAVQADVTNYDQVIAMRDTIREKLGDPSVYVANAVASPVVWDSVLEADNAEFKKQYDGCVKQAVNLAKAFTPAMMEKAYGRVIAINTEAILMNDPGFAVYNCGKKGLDAFMRVLAKEVGRKNITVNMIAPGNTITDRSRELNEVEQPEYTCRVPLGRRGTAEEIAGVVSFFASEYASFTTGCYIPVSGGIVNTCI